jgi:hypothetical protein
MAPAAERLLTASTPRAVARAAAAVAGDTVKDIESSLPRALDGERDQVRAYVGAYRELTGRVLEAAGQARPDLVTIGEDGQLRVYEMKAHRQTAAGVPWVKAALEQEAISAPFSAWVGALGPGAGTAGAVAAMLRSLLRGTVALTPPNGRLPEWELDERQVVRFSRAVLDELARSETPLEHISEVLGLTRTQLASLFGVRRQAIDQWAARGVPADRQEKLATIGEIADLLAGKLKRDRIPGVVRRAAAAYGDRSMLDAIAAGAEDEVLAELRDAFDWAAAA